MARSQRVRECLLLVAIFSSADALKNGDCLRPEAATSFINTPGGYDPHGGIGSTQCQTLCAGIPMPYSGIQEGKFCFCSDDPFVEKAAAAKDDVCEKHPFAVRFYFSSLFTPIENMRVMPSQSVVSVGEELSFHIVVSSGKDAHVVMDFGDGTDGINGSLGMEPKYIYWKPGKYDVQVMARPTTAHDIFTMFAHTMIVVTTSPDEKDIVWTCPALVEPNAKFPCRLDILRGTDMSLDFLPGDGTGNKPRNIPDVYPTIVGERVPQFESPSVVIDEEDTADSAVLPRARVLHEGKIFAFQGFGALQGKLDILLLRPACTGCSFEEDTVKCEGRTTLCLTKMACIDPDMCPKRDVSEIYKIIQVIPIQVKKGYFVHKLPKPVSVTAGDIFGFTTTGGRLAYRLVSEEESDLSKRNSLKGQAVRTDDLKAKDQRFLVSALINTPINLTFEYQYDEAGAYEVAVNVKNKYHEQVIRKMADVSSQQKLTAFKLDVSQNQVPTGSEVQVSAKMFGGSDLTMTWNFGDGAVEKQVIATVATGQKFTKKHKYAEAGVYIIQVNSSNLHGSFVARRSVVVQRPVTDAWEVFSNAPVILPETVHVTLTYPKTEKLPTDATVRVNFGDKQKDKWKVPNEVEDKVNQKFVHSYQKPGFYNIQMNISNLISHYLLTERVEVATRAQGLSAKMQFQRAESAEFENGLGSQGDIFLTTRPITIFVKLASGLVENFFLETKKGAQLANGTSTQRKYTLNFPKAGQYDIFVYAWNHVQHRTDPYILSFRTMEPIEGLDVYMNETTPKDEYIRNFMVSFDLMGSDTCVIVDYGDGTSLRAFGSRSQCFSRYKPEDFEMEGELSNPLLLTNIYERGFDYMFTLTSFNEISEGSKTFNFTVNNEPCKAPVLKIRNQVLDVNNASFWYRNKAVELYTFTELECNISIDVSRRWEAFFVDPEKEGEVIHEIDITELDSVTKSMLYVPEFFFDPGFYKLRYNVNMSAPSARPPMFHRKFVETFIEIKPSLVIPQMSEGAQSRVTRGFPQTLILNPANYSINPDDPEDKEFNITWYCRRVNVGENIDRSVPHDQQHLINPIYKRMKDLPVILAQGRKFNSTTYIAQENVPDQGGCFGTGPGRINLTEGELEWSTIVFFKPNETYEILVHIDKGDRPPSWGAIQVVLMEQVPPSITVKCQTEKLCYPHEPIGQKINPVRVGLTGVCAENCDGELIYAWEVFGAENDTEVPLEDAPQYLVGANELKMALSDEFFKIYYPMFGDFIAKLTVTNEYGVSGVSDLFLHINKPPQDGLCKFSPLEGRALLDKFTASCSGWTDPEGMDIEFYAFWVRNLENEVLAFLTYGPDHTVHLLLPYGDFQVGADVKDKEGATTRVNLTTIATKPPTKTEFEIYLNDRSLDNADAAGDQAKMNQMAQAITSLMNVRLSDDYENEIDLDNNTEARDKELEEQAALRSRMIRSVSSIMNVDTLNSIEQVGSALTAIAGDGNGVDNEGKELIIKLLRKTVKLAKTMKVEAPQQLLDFCMYAVGTMGGIVARMTQQLLEGTVMPTDRAKAVNLEYDTEIALDGEEEKESLFDGSLPMEKALERAVVLEERKSAELQISTMITLTIDMVLAMLRNIIVGEKPLEFAAPSGLGMTISMFSGGALSGKSIQHGDAVYVFPGVCDMLAAQANCAGNETLGIMAVSWPAILQSFGGSVDVLSKDSKTLQLIVLDDSLHPIDISNTTDYFTIIVPRKGSNENGTGLPEPTHFSPTPKWNEQMVYHQFLVPKPDSAVNIEVTPDSPDNSRLLVYVKHREKPLLHDYDMVFNLSQARNTNGTYDIFLDNSLINNRTGFFYLGITEANVSLPELTMNSTNTFNLTEQEISRELSTDYALRVYTSGCYFYNKHSKTWSGDGCFVHNANYMATYCKCNHLTSFGSGFFVVPNTIDFSYVFANAGFADNITIYMCVILTMLIYLLLIIWARREDLKDNEKLCAHPLPDNDNRDNYLYEITVFTGDKDGAATDSRIFLILSGDDDETDARTFGDSKSKLFRRGGIDTFVMACPKPLGRLNYMRLWHDNSGKGKFRSWYLRFISIRDVQTNARYDFIANKWFAVEKQDGQVDRLLPVAGKEEATEFNHLFQLKTQKNLADGHLWFSVFLRPPRSRFTRCQRVSCCIALLYLSMLVNAMWYGRVPSKPSASALNVGPFALSPEQVGVGILANLIVFPPTFLMITLFRKARLRRKRPNRIMEALKKQRKNSLIVGRNNTTDSTLDLMQAKDGSVTDIALASKKAKKKAAAKKKTLPYWCRQVAWFICLSSIFVSVFFIWAYGVQFGDEKTRKWITSLLVSFFTSVLVTQPIKVFMTAIILSALFKSPQKDDQDEDDDEEEAFTSSAGLYQSSSAASQRRKNYKPPVKGELDHIRDERMRELKMSSILREIFSYLLFLWLLTVLSYGNRDPNAYFMQMNLKNQFINNGKFMEISSTDAFYKYMREIVVPNVKVGEWYNGQQPFGLRGFIGDRVNRIMGFAVMRQIRARENSCKVEKLMRNVVSQCRGQSKLTKEDKKHYEPGWTALNKSVVIHPLNTTNEEWRHKRAKELHGLPFWGKLDVYGGGGYVMNLRGTRAKIIEKLKELEVSDWIDGGTRAVFVEFSVYNAQVNLFGVVTIIAEFHPGGGIVPNYRIDAIRLMRYHQGFGLFVMLCELAFVGFIIYFTVKEVKQFIQLRVDYFRSYWNIAELVVLSLSYSCMFFYISRMAMTVKLLRVFKKSSGNAYMKLQVVAAVDEVFGYLMSFLIFISILKFTKLLRFNKRIGVLYSTLAQCSKDLSSFFVVFWVIFLAFTQVFYVVLGTKMKDFSSFVRSAETCFDMARGHFKFDEISMASPVVGPFVFFVFAFITSVILLNLFVTLIISSFQAVKADIEKQCNDYEIISFMGRKVKGFFGMNKGDGKSSSQPVTVDSQIHALPEKVDRLLGFINDVYLDGEIALDNKRQLKVLYKAPEAPSSNPDAQPSMFEWVEVDRSSASTKPSGRPRKPSALARPSGQGRRY